MKFISASKDQIDIIQDILDSAPSFHLNTEGIEQIPGGTEELLKELPPKTPRERKKVFLIQVENQNIGLCDLVLGYPTQDIGFIGLLLFKEEFQGKGYGRLAYYLLKDYALEMGMKSLQLGVVESNPVEEFWKKMGFSRINRSRKHIGAKLESVVHVYEATL